MTEPNQDWFHHSVFATRSMRSTIWTVAISLFWIFLISSMSFLVQSPLHPFTAVVSTANFLLTPSSLFHLFVFLATIVWSSVKHSQNFSLTPSVFHSWSKLITSSVQPTISSSIACFIMQSIFLAWCLLKLAWVEYSNFFSKCTMDEKSWCVSHEHLFLLGCGAVTGFFVAVRYHFYSDNCVSFPVIYKESTTQMKEQMRPLLFNAVKQALHILKYYYFLYIVSVMVIFSSLPISPLSTTLLMAAMSITTLILLTNYTKLKIFSVFLSAPLPSVPLEQVLSSLSPSSPPLLYHLSLQSLSRLTATSLPTRSTIFSLSQPGGHPHSWNTVSQSCLSSLDNISTALSALMSPKPSAPITPTNKPELHQISSPGMRRLAPAYGAKMEEVPVPLSITPAKQMLSSITSVLDSLKKQTGVSWLFKAQPDASLRAIFCKAQSAIWSVDVLSYLVASSIVEDRFGVVQKELASILTTLLSLDQKLAGQRKTGGTPDADIKLKNELKAAVKAGLYRIAIHFGEHIQAVPLERELSLKMMNYQKLLEAS